jgi:flavodoxin
MKSLVVYYSRTGNTEKVATDIARLLGSDMEKLVEKNDRSGIAGYLKAGKDAMLKKNAALAQLQHGVGEYDLVVIGTPVWAFTMTPAVRTYIDHARGQVHDIAFFCTMGGSGAKRTFREMAETAGKTPVATLALTEKQLGSEDSETLLQGFVEQLQQAAENPATGDDE